MEQLGDYRLLEGLARGTTGRVYAASRWPAIGIHHLVAVKVFTDEISRNERFVLLLREGIAQALRFEHPGLIQVLEISGRTDPLVVVSELVDGQPLDKVLRHWTERETAVDPALPLWMIHKLAGILTAAHSMGLVHGHLAPDQVILTYEGEIRLLGLGLGEARGVLPLHDRRRPFLAPEVLRTGVASTASDVHGLARVFHHALAGAHSVLSTPGIDAPAWLPPLRSYGVTIHPALETMVESMLAASPNARPPLEEVESALGSSVGTRGSTMRAQLSRLMQTAFTSELAAANLRRQRIARGPDDVATAEGLALSLQGRGLSDDNGFSPGRYSSFENDENGVDLDHDPTIDPPVFHPPFVELTAEDVRAPSLGWTETAPLRELTPTTTIPRRAEPSPSYAMLRPRADLIGGGVYPSDSGHEVPAADPRLKALESGDDESLMALVDAIVSHSTPPQGVEAEPNFEPDDLLDGPLLLDDDQNAYHVSVEVADDPLSLIDDDAASVSHDSALPPPEPLPPDAIFSEELPRLPPGTVIGERYRIEDVIGEGGVSVVYRCSHSFLRKDVAIKVLRPELASMPPVVERFHREARSVAQLDHPNIVRVIDFGKSGSGSLFLVMDLIEGMSLADQLDREGWLAPTTAVRISIGILTGLEHAHARGVVHRDLKPDNIMLVGGETGPTEVKILDFGIAKLGDGELGRRPITEAGMVFGTPRYMSPEQAAGEPVDHRSDLFSVGIILYQLLSGQLPFDGDTTVQILRRVLTQPAPRLKVNGLPTATSEAIADVVSRSLAKNPEERFASARNMREALQAYFPL